MAFSGFLGAAGASKGIKTLKEALRFQKKVYADTKANADPFIQGGTNAFNQLSSGDFRNTEFYDFRKQELDRQIQRSLGQKGQLFSGAAIEAQARGNTVLTGEQVQNEQNLLLSLSQIGLNGVNSVANAGGNAASQVGQTSANIANMQKTRGQLLGGAIDETLGAVAGAAMGFSSFGGLGGLGAGAGSQVGSQAQGTLQAANAQRLFPIPGY